MVFLNGKRPCGATWYNQIGLMKRGSIAYRGIQTNLSIVLAYLSETLRHGKRAGVKVACIPLVTDAPIVLTSGLLFTQITNMNILLGGISVFGSIFLLNLGIKSIRAANSEFRDSLPVHCC